MALTINDISAIAGALGGKGLFTPEILANKQYASWYYGAQSPGQYMYAIPRYRFMYYANWVVNSQAAVLYPWLRQLGSIEGVSFKIKSIDKPKITLKHTVVNQYNRRRPVYTATDFQNVTVTMYDTVDNKTYDFWRQYMTYFFGDARQKSPMVMSSSPVDPQFMDGTGWGLRPLAEQTNFFTALEIYAIFGGQYSRTTYLNPKIVSSTWGSYDSSSSDLTDVSFGVAYETVNYDPNQEITPAIASQFGFDVGPPVPEPNTNVGAAIGQSLLNVTDSMLAQRNLNVNSPQAIISQGVSALANFGMAGVSYGAFTQTGGSGLFSGDETPGSIQYASATAAFDNVYSNIPGGAAYSDSPSGGGLLGLPFGQLPGLTQAIAQPLVSSFAAIGSGLGSTLGSFGSFNFGSGGLEVP